MSDADVIVVGGGIYGAAVSFELARAGVAVTLVERSELASGASGGTGLRGVRANERDLRELPLMRIANDIWPTLDDELGQDAGFRRIGGLCLFEADIADDAPALARITAMVAAQNAHGHPSQLVDAERVRELEPGVSDAVVGGVYTPLDGVGDHTRVTRAYAAAAAAHGALIIEHVEVVGIEAGAGAAAGGSVLTDDGRRLRANLAVVVLANSYTARLLGRSFGLELPVWRYNPQMTPVRARSGFVTRHLVGHFSRVFSAKTIDGGLVMLSGGRSGTWDERADTGRPVTAVAEASVRDAGAIFPELVGAEIVLTDASRPDSVSVDEIPIIDRVPTATSVYFGTGWSGHGFAIAPAVARLLAGWIRTGERAPELVPFELARFGAAVPR